MDVLMPFSRFVERRFLLDETLPCDWIEPAVEAMGTPSIRRRQDCLNLRAEHIALATRQHAVQLEVVCNSSGSR
ncbi:hypothetical protein [Burkholderia gladioli]|uniref:hypothetical protein n=1 Tax=Burkholderia gladioli TaxID=28095 RepID=UPI0016404BEF|nr:hypothetical protein [Burkholderia gladioli]